MEQARRLNKHSENKAIESLSGTRCGMQPYISDYFS